MKYIMFLTVIMIILCSCDNVQKNDSYLNDNAIPTARKAEREKQTQTASSGEQTAPHPQPPFPRQAKIARQSRRSFKSKLRRLYLLPESVKHKIPHYRNYSDFMLINTIKVRFDLFTK